MTDRRRPAGRVVEVSPELQRDFSLNQTLSLYLLEALAVLDRDAPTYALDVLTLVEAILEDPDVVLRRQLDLLKDEKMAQMKADGVEYEQRIAELEALEWPKPNRDFIYATFNDFAGAPPVGRPREHPPQVGGARDVRDLRRVQSSTCATWASNAARGSCCATCRRSGRRSSRRCRWRRGPRRCWTCSPTSARCCATSTPACSTSGRRWRTRRAGARAPRATRRSPSTPRQSGGRALAVIRAELHKLVAALSRRDHAAAARLVGSGDGEPWTPERLAAAMAPFWAEHKLLLVTPEARRPDRTQLDEIEPRQFRAQQTLVDGDGDEDWSVDCRVDLDRPRGDGEPLLQLVRIGV